MFHLTLNKQAPKPQKGSILRKAARQMLLLSVTVVLVLTCIAFLAARSLLLQKVLAQLSSSASFAEDRIEQATHTARVSSSLLSAHPRVQGALRGKDVDGFGEWFNALQTEQQTLLGLAVYAKDGKALAQAGQVPSAVDLPKAGLSLVIGDHGWQAYDVAVPVRGEGVLQGTLVARYAAADLLVPLLASLPSLGQSADLLIGIERDSRLILLHPAADAAQSYAVILGNVGEQYAFDLPLARAVKGEEGAGEAEDHKGTVVLGAHRWIPSVGAGLFIQVDKSEALKGVQLLLRTFVAAGIALCLFSALLAFFLSRELTKPLRTLADKVRDLAPGHWDYARNIASGDEVEVLDSVVGDMAERLQAVYENLESEVRSRTEELRAQYVFDRTVLEAIGHGVMAVGKDGRISAVNPACEILLGTTHEELLGSLPPEVAVMLTEGQKPLARHPLTQCLMGTPFHPEPGQKLSIKCKNNTYLPVMLLAAPLSEEGVPFGAVMVFQDVRDERRLDEIKSEFVTLASHQLRTPLSILRWQVDILKENAAKMEEDGRTAVGEIEQASLRMANLLNALLQVVQLEGGALTPDIASVEVSSVVRGMVSELKDIMARRKITCRLLLPDKELRIQSDAALLGIVVQNLLTNAVKYSRENAVIEVQVIEQAEGICVIVRDAGLGIPEREQSKLFQKFFRARNIKTVDTDGSGLGLYILKMIVDGLQGTINFHSKEGQGSEFTVCLPKSVKRGPEKKA